MPIILGRGQGSGGGSGGAPSGPAGGDLTGTYPNPTLGAGVVDTAELAFDSVDSTIIDGADAANIRSTLGIAIEAIETQTLGATGNIDFQNIPATYKHLRIVAFIRSAQANNTETLRLRFNNDTSTTGYGGYIQMANTTLSGVNDVSGGAYVLCGQIVGNSATANRFSAVVFDIPNYATSSNHKSVTCNWEAMYSTTAASYVAGTGGGVWPVTTAISRILIWTGSGAGQLLTGSTATLYGLS